MTDTQRKRGRPKAPAKKTYTIRLDAQLASILDLHVDAVKRANPDAVLNDMYEAIFHHFFFVLQGKNLRSRDSSVLLTLLDEYATYPDKYSAERWVLFNVLTAEDIEVIAQREHHALIKRQAETRARLAELRQIREAYDAERQIRLIHALQERIQALEAQRETS